MPRSRKVTINEKEYEVKELRVKEMKDRIYPIVSGLFDKEQLSELDKLDVGAVAVKLQTKLTEIFPGITEEDIDNAYPSELEELIQAFLDVNFQGLKKVWGSLAYVMKANMLKQ